MSWWQSLIEKIKTFLGIAPQEAVVPATDVAATPSAATTPHEDAAQEVTPVQDVIPPAPTVQAYLDLKQPVQEQSGLLVSEHYPAQFQVVEFPHLAQDGEAKVTGNNQAFFFVANPKGNTDPEQMVLDTSKLKTLLENIHENKTRFTLALDADVLDAPERFVQKYQALRPEAEQVTREAMLAKEVQLIGDFIRNDGVRDLVREVIVERNAANGQTLPAQAVEALTEGFLKQHFQLEGLVTEQPLEAATWQVDGVQGMLLATQDYAAGTESTRRGWKIGTLPELTQLAIEKGAQAEVAESIISAATRVNDLPVTPLQPAAPAQAKAASMQR